jgi:hypothetical protein
MSKCEKRNYWVVDMGLKLHQNDHLITLYKVHVNMYSSAIDLSQHLTSIDTELIGFVCLITGQCSGGPPVAWVYAVIIAACHLWSVFACAVQSQKAIVA